jgi:hypothetical protein
VGAAGVGVTEKEENQRGVDQQHMFHRVARVLAALRARLLRRILGALEAPFRPVVPNRGEAGTGAEAAAGEVDVGDGPVIGTTMVAASASVTPRRLANSVKERVGASPQARRAARRTTSRT